MKQVPAQKLKKLTLSKYYMTDRGAAENVFSTSCLMASIFKAILSTVFVTLGTRTVVTIIRKTAYFWAKKIMSLRGEAVHTGLFSLETFQFVIRLCKKFVYLKIQ